MIALPKKGAQKGGDTMIVGLLLGLVATASALTHKIDDRINALEAKLGALSVHQG